MSFTTIVCQILFSRAKSFSPRELESNANPQENEQDPKEDFEPVVNPEEALIRTRSGCTVKSTRKKDFEYNFMLPSYNVLSPSISSSLETHCQSTPLTSKALAAHLLLLPSTPSYSFNLLYSSYRKLCISPVLLPCDEEARIRREQRSRAELLGQQVFWVLDSGIDRMAFHAQIERNALLPRQRPRRLDQRFRRSLPDASPQARRPMAATAPSPRADRLRGRTPSLVGRIPWIRPKPS